MHVLFCFLQFVVSRAGQEVASYHLLSYACQNLRE